MKSTVRLELNGFVMNAGILGFIRLLEHLEAVQGEDYEFKDNALVLNKESLKTMDLAKGYLHATNELFYSKSFYPSLFTTISKIHRLMKEKGEKGFTKEQTSQLKEFYLKITGSSATLYSDSFKSGYKIILNETGIDVKAKLDALKAEKDWDRKLKHLDELKTLLEHDYVKEVLCFKSLMYRILNRFWENKAFLSTKVTSEMARLLDDEVLSPMRAQLDKSEPQRKPTRFCLECGSPHVKASSTSLSILKDMADDTARKSSAFWNFDASGTSLCDVCTFTYLLMPLGFTPVGHDMVFVNANASIEDLIEANKRKAFSDDQPFGWSEFYNNLLVNYVQKELVQLNNLQLVTRTMDEPFNYRFDILSRDILLLIKESGKPLSDLSKSRSIRLPRRYFNPCEETLIRILNHQDLYRLMREIIRYSLDPENYAAATYSLGPIFQIQKKKRLLQIKHLQEEGGSYMTQEQFKVAINNAFNDGQTLRRVYYKADKKTDGIICRLLNATQSNNRDLFLQTIVKLHSTNGLLLTKEFVRAIGDESLFKDLAHAYLLGLQGVYDSTYSKGKETKSEGAIENEEN